MNPFFGGQFFSGGFFGSLVGGTSKRDRKRKTRVLRRSEFSEEEFKEQFQALTSEIEVKPFTPLEQADLTEDEDDALLLKVLALTIH